MSSHPTQQMSIVVLRDYMCGVPLVLSPGSEASSYHILWGIACFSKLMSSGASIRVKKRVCPLNETHRECLSDPGLASVPFDEQSSPLGTSSWSPQRLLIDHDDTEEDTSCFSLHCSTNFCSSHTMFTCLLLKVVVWRLDVYSCLLPSLPLLSLNAVTHSRRGTQQISTH